MEIMVVRPYTRGQSARVLVRTWVNCVTTLTKIVALSMQMLERKPNEELVLTVEEQPIEYEA